MKRRYLETVEDFLEFKDTDTKIYNSCSGIYYQFINGYFCRFYNDGGFIFNVGIEVNPTDYYVLEEEKDNGNPVHEATEDDLGCLCYCWDEEDDKEELGILESYDPSDDDRYHITDLGWFQHCRRLSPSEVAEITGYKVEEK